jgi:hypothetical protein
MCPEQTVTYVSERSFTLRAWNQLAAVFGLWTGSGKASTNRV